MGFSRGELAGCLAGFRFEFFLLVSDPAELLNYRQTDSVVVDMLWGGDANASVWWVDGQVEVLDVFADDVYLIDVTEGCLEGGLAET